MDLRFENHCIALDSARVEALLDAIGKGEGECLRLSILVVGDERMVEVHDQSHGDPTTTDVVTFDLRGDGPGECEDDVDAELIVNAEMARREAEERGHDPEAELLFYIAHGALHVLGYDDHDDEERARMLARQGRYLDELGLPLKS